MLHDLFSLQEHKRLRHVRENLLKEVQERDQRLENAMEDLNSVSAKLFWTSFLCILEGYMDGAKQIYGLLSPFCGPGLLTSHCVRSCTCALFVQHVGVFVNEEKKHQCD